MAPSKLKEYFNPKFPGSFGGVDEFARNTKVSVKKARDWLKKQQTYTLFKPTRKRFNTRPYRVRYRDRLWQADLAQVDSISTSNNGYNFILTVIDVFSRYAWARPVKHKNGKMVTEAFNSILEEGREPDSLQTDQGKEFENSTFQGLLQRHQIKFYTIKSQFKAALAERFNRTLKTRLWRYFEHVGNYRWINVLPDFLDSYNATKHRSIGMAPKDVNEDNELDIWEKQEEQGPQQVTRRNPSTTFKVGDVVRMAIYKHSLHKGYLQGWTDEIFTVSKVMTTKPPQYKVKDEHGEEIEGSFYSAELQHVVRPKIYDIEKVIKKRKVNGKTEYFVKWKGYSNDYNSWVSDLYKRN